MKKRIKFWYWRTFRKKRLIKVKRTCFTISAPGAQYYGNGYWRMLNK